MGFLMLSDRDYQLLTAFVDGELSSRQRRHLERLLRRSAEARRLLDRLQQDARSLRDLPTPRLGRDLCSAVLGAIAARRLSARQGKGHAAPALPAWMAVAAAACVVFGLGVASFLYFSATLGQAPAPMAARPDNTRLPPTNPARDSVTPPAPEIPPKDDLAKISAPGPGPNPKAPAASIVERPKDRAPAPDSAADNNRGRDVLTDRMELVQIDQVEMSLPLVFKVHQLDSDGGSRLLADLRKARDFRLELPSRNGAKALERLQAACKALHISLVLDSSVAERLKQPHLAGSHFAFYVENLPAEDLLRLMQAAGQEDRRASADKPQDMQFDSLVLAAMTSRDRKELSALLGIDPMQPAVGPSAPIGADPRQSLPDLTAKQVADSLAGQGGVPRPDSGKTSVRPADQTALVLVYNPARPHPASAEIKRYLEGRKAARPGTLRVLLVIRG
jgi:hypothetical protein